MKAKYSPAVYGALRNAGMSNREIAANLGVSEAAVRRGLKALEAQVAPGLDPWPETRPSAVVVVDEPSGTFIRSTKSGGRLLRLARGTAADAELGRSVRQVLRHL